MKTKDWENFYKEVNQNESIDRFTTTATPILENVIKNCFDATGTLRILTNNDYADINCSPVAIILSEAYRRAAENLNLRYEILATKSLGDTDIPSDDAVKFIEETKPGDFVPFVLNIKQGKFSKKLGMLASNYLKKNKAKYAQHFRVGGIQLKEVEVYLNALNIDYIKLQNEAQKLKEKLENCEEIEFINKSGKTIKCNSKLKKINEISDGNYRGIDRDQFGGNLPAGEVWTESEDFTKLNGEFEVWVYPTDKEVIVLDTPITAYVKDGILVKLEGKDIRKLDTHIKLFKEKNKGTAFEKYSSLVREIGIGLNENSFLSQGMANIGYMEHARYYSKDREERQFHFSVGPSHSFYPTWKETIDKKVKPIGHADIISKGQIYIDGQRLD